MSSLGLAIKAEIGVMGAEGLGGYEGEEGDGPWVKPNGARERRRVVRAQILGADQRGQCCFHFTASLSLD